MFYKVSRQNLHCSYFAVLDYVSISYYATNMLKLGEVLRFVYLISVELSHLLYGWLVHIEAFFKVAACRGCERTSEGWSERNLQSGC
jgi:hypothetical protein